MNPNLGQRIADWFETHWVTPAYSGWLAGGLSIFFFAAATNTMAGWLYVISGVMFALLAVAAILPERSLRQIRITRRAIEPISAGEPLIVELVVENQTNQPKTLLQVQDMLPYVLGQPASTAIELIPGQGSYHWVYEHPTQRRGVFRWQTLQLRTATPLGLFWCRRSQTAKATAIVYPTVLPLNQCPLIDEMGRDVNVHVQSAYRAQGATEGVTRTLRPYRWGDSIRLIHWRTSARYGELRVRELETFTGGQEIIICLDTEMRGETPWEADNFEQAVIAAASLYFYAVHQNLQVGVWTAATGLVKGKQVVLETLAATSATEERRAERLPDVPLLWLTQDVRSLKALPDGSRWVLWSSPHTASEQGAIAHSGLVIQPDQPLQIQLQTSV
ncbi:DUF58 domain-containing protein [Oscillatoria sp. FACHB-1407]|uniref:DUF58 domain-containing protein n=1 Tax=Oscillatoria sp. FACHB-1407 TaxID=2692847 RepID=UPI001688FB4A|nr:DUF58 domain-containing protein [Oscillatoria sp. FACHB-1407]MBD2463330.1 DUF58 domain-containing protein [Oscillatoria sp. FACHB-1407]